MVQHLHRVFGQGEEGHEQLRPWERVLQKWTQGGDVMRNGWCSLTSKKGTAFFERVRGPDDAAEAAEAAAELAAGLAAEREAEEEAALLIQAHWFEARSSGRLARREAGRGRAAEQAARDVEQARQAVQQAELRQAATAQAHSEAEAEALQAAERLEAGGGDQQQQQQ